MGRRKNTRRNNYNRNISADPITKETNIGDPKDTKDINTTETVPKSRLNIKLIVIGVVFLLLFCAILLAGVTYTSVVFSKAITKSAISGAADAVRMINEERPKPIENLDLRQESILSAEVVDGAYMGAVRNRASEFAEITKATPEEIAAFDAMIRYASEMSQNKVLKVVFSSEDNANVNYAANGYNVWTYIMTVKKNSGIDFDTGVALLEAAALVEYSTENNIPLSLAVGVAQTESAFNPGAYSNKAACGPMQVVYDIHKGLLDSINIKTKDELFTPDRGVQAGCYLLGRYLRAEGSITGGLKRYYGELSPSYVTQVLNHRHAYELFAEGIEKDVVMSIEKEQVNWERMSDRKVPVYTETTKQPVKQTPAPAKKAPTTTTIRASTESSGLTIKPDSAESKGSQLYYNRTGTIIVPKTPPVSETSTEETAEEEEVIEKVDIRDLFKRSSDFIRD